VFIFRNRRGCSLKVLVYDGQGFWLSQKRLSSGRFHYWPKEDGQLISRLAAAELQLLIWNGNPADARKARLWKEIPVGA
jgi:transposase